MKRMKLFEALYACFEVKGVSDNGNDNFKEKKKTEYLFDGNLFSEDIKKIFEGTK